jgi:hypothetical protein
VLEAVGPLRSMLEFLIRLRWLAHEPDLNWKLWMSDDHAARDVWRKKARDHTPALHDAAVAALTPEQREEEEEIAAIRAQLAAELGKQWPGDRRQRNVEQMAAQVGLSVLYDSLYRYESNAAVHPSMLATDLLFETRPRGLLLCGEPTAQFVAPPVYLRGALLLHEALKDSGELTPALFLRDLAPIGRDIYALLQKQMIERLPNWRELLPPEVVEQIDQIYTAMHDAEQPEG